MERKKRMSPSGIDWPGLTHTWNPYKGCKHGCKYCIAEQWNKRYKWIPKWNEPQFFPELLESPHNHKNSCSIFVVFIGDLFGNWVDSKVIRQILGVCYATPRHKYWFLTKNPRRYQYFEFPENCIIGTSITGKETWSTQCEKYTFLVEGALNSEIKCFLSIEPLLGKIDVNIGEACDLVIVGAQTKPDVAPKKEWIDSIKHPNIHYKANIRKYMLGDIAN